MSTEGGHRKPMPELEGSRGDAKRPNDATGEGLNEGKASPPKGASLGPDVPPPGIGKGPGRFRFSNLPGEIRASTGEENKPQQDPRHNATFGETSHENGTPLHNVVEEPAKGEPLGGRKEQGDFFEESSTEGAEEKKPAGATGGGGDVPPTLPPTTEGPASKEPEDSREKKGAEGARDHNEQTAQETQPPQEPEQLRAIAREIVADAPLIFDPKQEKPQSQEIEERTVTGKENTDVFDARALLEKARSLEPLTLGNVGDLEASIASLEATHRAESRIPANGLEEMNINSYIASLTDVANSPITLPEVQKSLSRAAGLYAYLRDNQEAQTVGEATDSIAQRRIAPEVVKLWVDEGMAVNSREYSAILKGYPEYAEDLSRVYNENKRKKDRD